MHVPIRDSRINMSDCDDEKIISVGDFNVRIGNYEQWKKGYQIIYFKIFLVL